MCDQRFQWVSSDGHRHGVPATLVAGDEGMTLCGKPVIMPRIPLSQGPEHVRCAPTCEQCNLSWRGQWAVQRP